MVASAGGIGVGLLIAWYATGILEHFLFGIAAREPLVFGGAGMFALVVAALAALVPARHLKNLQPATVLRGE